MGLRELRALGPDDLARAGGLSAPTAAAAHAALCAALAALPADAGPAAAWRAVSRRALAPDDPLELHATLHAAAYSGWDAADAGPPPVWSPTRAEADATNAARFMAEALADLPAWRAAATGDPRADWPALWRLSVNGPEAFWPRALAALRVRWAAPPERTLADAGGDPDAVRWLPGARLNLAESALRGGRGAPDGARTAVLWADEAAPRAVRAVSLAELAQRAQHVADALAAAGLRPGDAVAIAMPLTPAAVAVFLGVVLAGCAAVSIAESFAPAEIAARLRVSRARLVFTQDVVPRSGRALPLHARIAAAPGAPRAVVVPASAADAWPLAAEPACALRPGGADEPLARFLARAPAPPLGAPPRGIDRDAYDLSGVLFSSGTTGEPKAIPWTHVTPLRCAVDAYFHQDLRPGDVACWPTSLGWMMGPWLVWASLLNGASVAIFQGAPTGRPFGEFVAAARTTMLGLVPSLARAWRASGCMAGLDWSALRCLSSTGEASTVGDSLWLSARAGHAAPVVEYIGGTEIGGGFLAGGPLQAQAPATFSTPTIGAAPVLLLADGRREEVVPVAWSGERGDSSSASSAAPAPPAAGELALRPPLLGASQRLLNADHAAVYYTGMPAPHLRLRRHGDELARLAGGRLRAQGRADDAMNLGGVKVAAAELERAVAARVRGAAEAAAVAARPPGGGPDRLVLFVVERAGGGAPRGEALCAACQAAVSAALNPLFRVEAAVAVAALPRTASNKVMRRVLRARAVELLYGGGGGGGGGAAEGGGGGEAPRAGDKARRRSKL